MLAGWINISGSMIGEKLALIKEAFLMIVGQLGPKDSFGIITFATDVAEALPMKNMDASYKLSAEQVIQRIQAARCANLSGGLFAVIDQACAMPFRRGKVPWWYGRFRWGNHARPASLSMRGSIANLFPSPSLSRQVDTMKSSSNNPAPPPAVPSSTKAAPTTVLLFTDGLANDGICDRSRIYAALKARLTDCPHVVVHTFGFGTDHDALLLQGIAEQSQGSYYFIKDQSVLKDSFADCLGGLVSVVSTGLTLRMAVGTGGACEVAQLMTKFPVTVEDDGTHVIAIKDLYSGESRDVPVQLKVRTAGVKSGAVMPLLTWTLSYHSTVDERTHTGTAKSTTIVNAERYSGAADVTVDEQRNRFLAAVALEEARKAAEASNFELAKQHIASCQQHIGQTVSAETQYTVALQQEMHQMMEAVSDARITTTLGQS
ncbi:membrane-associated protein, putative [Bodo saltans]|uniref:Membrane-associated protein, putative n=1 Tax=Bodo saltans TaxID=75058 RepID=A0A0S4JK85_BODSA|nr:membrane-associated protein, putative [Bodo saltans]|eukprot:CUG88905.1 membrane-associated protein, putative [Bodo saltans]